MPSATSIHSGLFGVMIVAWPAAGALSVVLLIAAYAIAFGAVLIRLGLRLRRRRPALVGTA